MIMEEKAKCIITDIKKEKSIDPSEIFRNIVSKEYMNIHGPEHHILAGASILVAYKNAGGEIDIDCALEKLMAEGLRMPGAMCGLWGVCGATTSIGAALAIIDGTGPLSVDGSWGNHMEFTSNAVAEMGKINGPRCCKRDAMISFGKAVDYMNEHYDAVLAYNPSRCEYSSMNQQCIKERCPYYERLVRD